SIVVAGDADGCAGIGFGLPVREEIRARDFQGTRAVRVKLAVVKVALHGEAAVEGVHVDAETGLRAFQSVAILGAGGILARFRGVMLAIDPVGRSAGGAAADAGTD